MLRSRSCGIARSAACITAPCAGIEPGFLKLNATIQADNPRAVVFYLGQGFRIVGAAQRHALVRGRYIDAVLAERFPA
jgi:RimJ/RimL family protein N-acetyltransferase